MIKSHQRTQKTKNNHKDDLLIKDRNQEHNIRFQLKRAGIKFDNSVSPYKLLQKYKSMASNASSSQSVKKHKKPKKISINEPITKKYVYLPINNISVANKSIRSTIKEEIIPETEEQRVRKSVAYQRLLLECEEMKKNHCREKQALQQQVDQLSEFVQIERNKKKSLMAKRQKLQDQISTYTEEVVRLQQNNYELYQQLRARYNQQEYYEDYSLQQVEQLDLNRGLDPQELQQFIAIQLKETDNNMTKEQISCCICCFDILAKDKTIKLPCSHLYHINCIRQWLVINKICPLCRLNVCP